MAVESSQDGVQWKTGRKVLAIERPNVFSALEDSHRKHLYVLHKDDTGREWLEGFTRSGSPVFKVQAPPGFHFSHLVLHPVQGSAVVMRADQMTDGWYDWHFTILSRGELLRGSPSY